MELNLTHRPNAHCENGAISTLLRYHGLDLSEPMIFGLAYGIFFTHIPFIKMGGMPVTSFRTFPGVLFTRIMNILGVKTTTRRFFLTHGHIWNEHNLPNVPPGTVLTHGHTHVPVIRELANGITLFNPGSISLPKNGMPQSFGFFNEKILSVLRLEDGSLLI